MKAIVTSSNPVTVPSGWNTAISSPFDMTNYDARYVRVRVPCNFQTKENEIDYMADMANQSFRVQLNGSIVTLVEDPNTPRYEPSKIREILVDAVLQSGSVYITVQTFIDKPNSGSGDDSTRRMGHYCQNVMTFQNNTGTFTDSRDGKVYKTVLMPDGKWWAAENLAWTGAGVDYNNDPLNRPTYGRLYNWTEAMASCPSGTHLPSDDEWTAMENACGTPATLGTRLKSTTLWSGGVSGVDEYGFNAMPSGVADPAFRVILTRTDFHSSTLYVGGPSIIVRSLSSGSTQLETISNVNQAYKRSVRFIVDGGNAPDANEIKSLQVDLYKSTTLEWNNATMEIH